MNEITKQHASTYAPMYFGDFVNAADGALNEYLDQQPPGASVELATQQYYSVVRTLAKHLSKAAHVRKVKDARKDPVSHGTGKSL